MGGITGYLTTSEMDVVKKNMPKLMKGHQNLCTSSSSANRRHTYDCLTLKADLENLVSVPPPPETLPPPTPPPSPIMIAAEQGMSTPTKCDISKSETLRTMVHKKSKIKKNKKRKRRKRKANPYHSSPEKKVKFEVPMSCDELIDDLSEVHFKHTRNKIETMFNNGWDPINAWKKDRPSTEWWATAIAKWSASEADTVHGPEEEEDEPVLGEDNPDKERSIEMSQHGRIWFDDSEDTAYSM